MTASPATRSSRGSRVLTALEIPSLVAVPVTLLVCAAAGVDASAGLTMLVVIVCLGLFFARYESSEPALRQIMPTVVLAAVAAAGRIVFAPFPDVKPVTAICIVAGTTLGRRNGFMVGAISALVSNAFFGQGPWTPWQMYAWGLVGYLAGAFASHGAFSRRGAIYVLGFASALLYGLVLNGYYIVGWVRPIELATVVAAFAAGLPWDLVHGAATVAFLLAIWTPWGSRIRRVVHKYGL